MPKEIEISVLPEQVESLDIIKRECAAILRISTKDITHFQVIKRSIDARRRPIIYLLKILVFIGEEPNVLDQHIQYPACHNKPEIIIVGAGPAGLFAALKAIESGLKPIVIERGKDVRNRRRDLAAINKDHLVNTESNYCFGEGGAGTYSDGKLYTRSTKRGSVSKILQVLVQFGANENIKVDAHPHIGTNKLPAIITAMREQIIASGGVVRFDCKLTDIHIQNNCVTGIEVNNSETIPATAMVLATGHSARDIFYLLHQKNILIEAKPFALGVRIEHQQPIIDKCQYKLVDRGDFLPPASYSLVEQVDGSGVFSFCMCPGGIIAPCATSPGEIVTNGWSPSKRNNPYANSGIVVTVDLKEFESYGFSGPLAGLKYQEMVEKQCWEAAGKTQAAPGQRLIDFVTGKESKDLPKCSYQPGVVPVRLDKLLPPTIAKRLQVAFVAFGKKMQGYYTNDAIIVAPESRTSSPVRIPRGKETFMHPEVNGLFPCGEGAGYAGGIVSAAIDGENCTVAAANYLIEKLERK